MDKVEIITALKKGEKNSSVCKSFNLSASTVSTLRKNEETILKAYQENNIQTKKMRLCANPDRDEALFKWFRVMRNENIPLSGPILKSQAEKFARQLGDAAFECRFNS